MLVLVKGILSQKRGEEELIYEITKLEDGSWKIDSGVSKPMVVDIHWKEFFKWNMKYTIVEIAGEEEEE